MAPYRTELEVAIGAAREAARLCEAVALDESLAPVGKRDASPVTAADFGSQALICRAIGDAFPDDPIIAEESAASLVSGPAAVLRSGVVAHVGAVVPDATEDRVLAWISRGSRTDAFDRYWAVDPIDGTKGYVRGAQYAVAIALVVEGRPVVAAMACPRLELGAYRGVLLSAARGGGARMARPKTDDAGEPLSVRRKAPEDEARFCESVERGHSSRGVAARVAEALGMKAPPVRLDSQAKYGVVAHGDADFYLRIPRGGRELEYVWDHAAGSLVVEEAGGRVSDMDGAPLDFGHGSRLAVNRGIVASNGTVHDAVLTELKRIALPD